MKETSSRKAKENGRRISARNLNKKMEASGTQINLLAAKIIKVRALVTHVEELVVLVVESVVLEEEVKGNTTRVAFMLQL